MPWDVKAWYRGRILKHEPLPDDLWRHVVAPVQFLRGLNSSELERLRECVTLFLHAKQINGALGLIVTDEMRATIAAQACILVLNLDLDYYDGWVEIIVYPGGFVRDYEYIDEDGVVHHARESASGESWLGGPVILSWEDAATVGPDSGYNVVIHEFAHKLDMLNGDANGFPPLHADMSREVWSAVFTRAYADFCKRIDEDEATALDPYAAENPSEFFAVMSEAFFQTPLVVRSHYPAVYEQLASFYRQDPALRLDV
ncbi:MAG TPA: M90 family metallopeptidase [Nitrosospira sp.]|nr:M90 family metallopeptidase [Nitrosospira sp.]